MSKGDFMICRGVLYHKDEVEGLPVCQLCAPQSKHLHSLKLAHNSASECHARVCGTPERGQLIFYWHGVCQSMHSCVRSRSSWRLRSTTTKGDPCATSRWWTTRAGQDRPDFADHYDVRVRGHRVKGGDLDVLLATVDADVCR